MTEVFAHRGVHRIARENTLGAFRAAIELGVDGVELDVRQTADGVLVIHHDPLIDGRALSGEIAAELPSYVPRLDDAMTILRGLTVNVEIKNSRDPDEPSYDDTGALARAVVDSLREMSWSDSVIISCFDRSTCEAVRARDANVELAWLVYEGVLDDSLRTAHDLGFNAVNPHLSLITPEGVDLARELSLALNVWTVNDARDILALGALNVASVITDEPELALDLLTRSN